jgi:hypothetical protein
MRARFLFIFILLFFIGLSSFAQKMAGFGGEFSVLGFKPNMRMWVSKTTGFEAFGGVDAEMNDLKFNDFNAGLKFLSTILYERTSRTYFGVVGKWKWVNLANENNVTTNLPIVGLLIGKEWSSKRKHRRGFAVEFGYQYGSKHYKVSDPVTHVLLGKDQYNEFPLILNLRYSFFKNK